MKFLAGRYRNISVWMSLAVLAMAFVIGSSQEKRSFWAPAAFVTGALMYALGAACEWEAGKRISCMAQGVLAACMGGAALLSFLQLGGIL